jgi:hypothetical protein
MDRPLTSCGSVSVMSSTVHVSLHSPPPCAMSVSSPAHVRPLITAPVSPLVAPPSGSGRPKRNVSAVNYAEAMDDTPRAGASASGSSRKRHASASPSKIRVRTPKSIMKQIMASASKRKNDDEEDSENDADEKMKSKAVMSLNFGTSKKKQVRARARRQHRARATAQRSWLTFVALCSCMRAPLFCSSMFALSQTGPSPKYVTHFVIAVEQICSRDAVLLGAYHVAMTKLLPVNPADLDKIRAAMEKILTKRVVERVNRAEEWMQR